MEGRYEEWYLGFTSGGMDGWRLVGIYDVMPRQAVFLCRRGGKDVTHTRMIAMMC
jgi:hypothetical protein